MQATGRTAGIQRISSSLGRLRMMIGRRVMGRLALRNVAPMLDVSDLDVLGLVPAAAGTGADPDGASVGDIARQLRIDPSRASRLVAELVQRGFLVRAISQQDGRRAVLRRSETGERVLAEVERLKHELIREIVGDWPEARLAAFARDFDGFTQALDARLSRPDLRQARPESRPEAS
ncbi:MarR family winged helix-turn-helix transcriptional regulator [Paracoccus thiocyanatus]|uniref:MarR family transcriptional regulator n=1 Tax=Paracoccus thiocyanatus TaxID=34006 RepID=A0A3D8PE49_9RHOB|nr:MarR family winged helix-turn-helix transcriptional regulator [Paracoccus thiocyanatus]RDW13551.1 MarR family transcriptional regulator [Paracoccus thiocyanatus]